MTAAASCAAIRAKLTNPVQTRFFDSNGEWIVAHSVPLQPACRGRTKLAKMAARTIEECLRDVPREEWADVPLLLCVAEATRPGRVAGVDGNLFADIQRELQVEFSSQSRIVPSGRTSVFAAMSHARRLLDGNSAPCVLIAATDSLLTAQTLRNYERAERLLTSANSNGFVPGEGAAAILIGAADAAARLYCAGLGFASEPATIDSEVPLRGEGLSSAIKAALADAGCHLQDISVRIADLSGEHYYFKEASLALSRILRQRREKLDLWHPAECIGESGATSGLATIVVADAACRKGYAPGPNILCHGSDDGSQRAAAILQFRAL
jgi:3-oxoacyl-[acyl-carrier-protein] synthase-1